MKYCKGRMGISDKPSFRKPMRSKLCLVIADAFIEGSTKEKLNKPYVIYPTWKNTDPLLLQVFTINGLTKKPER